MFWFIGRYKIDQLSLLSSELYLASTGWDHLWASMSWNALYHVFCYAGAAKSNPTSGCFWSDTCHVPVNVEIALHRLRWPLLINVSSCWSNFSWYFIRFSLVLASPFSGITSMKRSCSSSSSPATSDVFWASRSSSNCTSREIITFSCHYSIVCTTLYVGNIRLKLFQTTEDKASILSIMKPSTNTYFQEHVGAWSQVYDQTWFHKV